MSIHPPGEDFAIIFADRTGDDREQATMDAFVRELNDVAERYGFKWRQLGPRSIIRKSLADEQGMIDHHDLAEVLADFRRRRGAEDAG